MVWKYISIFSELFGPTSFTLLIPMDWRDLIKKEMASLQHQAMESKELLVNLLANSKLPTESSEAIDKMARMHMRFSNSVFQLAKTWRTWVYDEFLGVFISHCHDELKKSTSNCRLQWQLHLRHMKSLLSGRPPKGALAWTVLWMKGLLASPASTSGISISSLWGPMLHTWHVHVVQLLT